MTDEKEKNLTEEELIKQEEARFKELNAKAEEERSEEENKELGELKEHYGKRVQKRLDRLTRDRELERERADKAEQELTEAKERLKKLEEKTPAEVQGDENEVLDIDGKKWLTDGALLVRIKAGKMTDAKAIEYQKARDKEEAVVEAVNRIERKKVDEDVKNIRVNDAKEVLEKYPQFDKKHAEFNPEDPLYKLSTELYNESYAANPKGLSLAIKRAKQILRISDEHIDRSDDFSLEDSHAPERKPRQKEVILTESEKEVAETMYTNVENPKTRRTYTVQEAHLKALEAKKERLASREAK